MPVADFVEGFVEGSRGRLRFEARWFWNFVEAPFSVERGVALARGHEYGRGMASTEKIKPRDLVVGGRYLHRNGLFIRQIEAIEGNTVHYHDQASSWSCSNSVFVRTCPTLATPEDEARVAEELRKLARLERK